MPIIREYDQRVSSSSAGQARSYADPNTARHLGDGLAALGRGISQAADVAHDVAVQREQSTLQADLATTRADLSGELMRARETGEAAAPGFVTDFGAKIDERVAALQEKMQTRVGMEAARMHGVQLSAAFRGQAEQEQALVSGELAKQNHLAALNTNRNVLLGDPTQFGAILAETQGLVNDPNGAYATLPAPVRAQLLRETGAQLALSAVQGLVEQNPLAAQKQLRAGAWDAYLDADHKAALLGQAGARAAEIDGVARFNAMIRLRDSADKGLLPTRDVTAAVGAKLISPDQGVSLYEFNVRRQKEIERERILGVRITLGDPVGLVGYSPAERQKGFDEFAGKVMGQAGDDQQARTMAINRIVTTGRQLNLIPSQMKEQMASASVSRPQQFLQAAQWYDGLRAVDPSYADAHVSADQAALFDVALTALRGGASESAAIELARQAGDPENQKKLRANLDGSTLSRIESKLKSGWLFKTAASNAGWAAKEVSDLAKQRVVFGDSSPEAAADWALAQFKARHTLVGGRWLPIQDDVSPDVPMALSGYLARVPDALKKHGAKEADADPSGYDLRADRQTQIDGSLQVYGKSDGLPVPGWRIRTRDALDAYTAEKDTKAAAGAHDAARKLKAIQDAAAPTSGIAAAEALGR